MRSRSDADCPVPGRGARPPSSEMTFDEGLVALGRALARGGVQLRDHLPGRLRHKVAELEAGPNEAGAAHMGKQDEQRLPEARDVEKQDRLVVPAKLGPGH